MSALYTDVSHDTITVIDPDGGRWWPSDEALVEIEASENPTAAAIRICTEQPARGEWVA